MKSNKMKLMVSVLLVVIFSVCVYFLMTRLAKKACKVEIQKTEIFAKNSENIEVVPTRKDEIPENAAWCGTFQLVWNDMVNEIVGQDVKFEKPLKMVENLNKQDFNEQSISDAYYYKKFGRKNLALKAEIEQGIQEKFNETSDILDSLDWSEESLDGVNGQNRYLFYTMLKRDFTYENELTQLENGKFANQYDDIKYFGIDASTKKEVRSQVDVLYYVSKKDCAVVLNTVEGDQVIVCKGSQGKTFQEIYENVMKKADTYTGNKTFGEVDYLKVPELDFSVKREYDELCNQPFYEKNGDIAQIQKAIQSIQMKMDKTGGTVKSEAVIDMEDYALVEPEKSEPRYFEFDEEYMVFLLEKGKEEPYFAVRIEDITKFQ